MKNSIYIFVFALLHVFSVSCSEAENDLMPTAIVSISGHIEAPTRVYNTSWQSGDAIGIFMESLRSGEPMADAYNLKYVTPNGNGQFEPVNGDKDLIYFPVSGIAVQLRAYYPYRSSLAGNDIDPIYQVNDWSVQADSASFDLLLATDQGSATDPDINFTFRHACSRIIIDLSADVTSGITNSDLAGAAISISNMNRSVGYHLLNGEVDYGNTLATPISLLMNADGRRGHAFLPPEEYGYFVASNRIVTITLRNGTIYKWAIPSTQYFEANKCYPYKLTLNAYNNTVSATGDCIEIAFGGELQPIVPEITEINGKDCVDLGLPSGLKWAKYNVGATTESGYGYLYPWGGTMTKSPYNSSSSDIRKWGATWRIPTSEDFSELKANCTYKWYTTTSSPYNKVAGAEFSRNGKTVFFPAAGYTSWSARDYNDRGTSAWYWYSDHARSGVSYTSRGTSALTTDEYTECAYRLVSP